MTFEMEFANRLRTERTHLGLTQDNLAQMVGTTANCISQYENGKRVPRLKMVSAMSQVMGVSLDSLIPNADIIDGVAVDQLSIFDIDGGNDNE